MKQSIIVELFSLLTKGRDMITSSSNFQLLVRFQVELLQKFQETESDWYKETASIKNQTSRHQMNNNGILKLDWAGPGYEYGVCLSKVRQKKKRDRIWVHMNCKGLRHEGRGEGVPATLGKNRNKMAGSRVRCFSFSMLSNNVDLSLRFHGTST